VSLISSLLMLLIAIAAILLTIINNRLTKLCESTAQRPLLTAQYILILAIAVLNFGIGIPSWMNIFSR